MSSAALGRYLPRVLAREIMENPGAGDPDTVAPPGVPGAVLIVRPSSSTLPRTRCSHVSDTSPSPHDDAWSHSRREALEANTRSLARSLRTLF
jgi:hypothetical protein